MTRFISEPISAEESDTPHAMRKYAQFVAEHPEMEDTPWET
jgi:hypothetical protein